MAYMEEMLMELQLRGIMAIGVLLKGLYISENEKRIR